MIRRSRRVDSPHKRSIVCGRWSSVWSELADAGVLRGVKDPPTSSDTPASNESYPITPAATRCDTILPSFVGAVTTTTYRGVGLSDLDSAIRSTLGMIRCDSELTANPNVLAECS